MVAIRDLAWSNHMPAYHYQTKVKYSSVNHWIYHPFAIQHIWRLIAHNQVRFYPHLIFCVMFKTDYSTEIRQIGILDKYFFKSSFELKSPKLKS